jgi:hypothetical protein
MFLSGWRFFRRPTGAGYGRRSPAHRPSFRPELEALEPRLNPSSLGHRVIHAINYSPTWQGFAATGSFFDSDFAHVGVVGLWGREKNGKPDLNPATNMTDSESTFGAEMVADTQPTVSIGPGNTPGTYPQTTLLFVAQTAPETFAGGSLPPMPYRVEKLFAVTSEGHPHGTKLLDELRSLFKM